MPRSQWLNWCDLQRWHGSAIKAKPARLRALIADWIWNAILPTLCYFVLLIAGMMVPAHISAALYSTAAVALLLLLIGIPNAWDIAVWFMAMRPMNKGKKSKPPAPPSNPPAP
jgi:hypothetical protein